MRPWVVMGAALGLSLGGLWIDGRGEGALAQETIIPLTGEVAAGEPDHVRVPFEVPAGIAEIEVRHDDLSEANILDWGLEDPSGFRGWGGGNTEPAIVAELAASRSYLPGPITPGTWNVIIGKAKIARPPAPYQIEVVLRETATLPPQPERAPYVAPAPLETGARWYAGDFHVHSRDSGDARPALDEILDFAASQGLDFVVITDHNTNAHLDFFVDAQSRHPDVLLIPGVEWTSYDGHAGAFGATEWVDHKVGLDGWTASAAMESYLSAGALFSVNHPAFDLGDLCIGCAWKHDIDLSKIHGVELGTAISHTLLLKPTVSFWESALDAGSHAAALAGSDDHGAGVELGTFETPIGTPRTMVYASELSVEGILEGVRRGRTVARLSGAAAPMIELVADGLEGDTVSGAEVTVRATITGASGAEARFVRDGTGEDPVAVSSDPFELELVVQASPGAVSRVRAEAIVGGITQTITSHIFVEHAEGTGPSPSPPATEGEGSSGDDGCGCAVVGGGGAREGGVAAAAVLVGLALAARRRRRTTERRDWGIATATVGVLGALSTGCEEPSTTPSTATATASIRAAATAAPSAAPTSTAVARPMPPRPVPIGSSGPIQPSDPPEKQMMTITYTMAMLAPRPGDPPIIEDAYVERMIAELTKVTRAQGGAKLGAEPARGAKGNRKLEVDVGTCTDATPLTIMKAAGSSLREAYNAGVLVVACRDSKWECHQSTRDEKDVLCHAAPR